MTNINESITSDINTYLQKKPNPEDSLLIPAGYRFMNPSKIQVAPGTLFLIQSSRNVRISFSLSEGLWIE